MYITKRKSLLGICVASCVAVASLFTSLNAAETEDNFIIVKPKNSDDLQTQEKKGTFLSDKFSKIAALAKDLIGIRYRTGGSNPRTGFDCSGFVSYVFNEGAGIKLPRSSRDMRSVGRAVDIKSLKPGDLVFFKINTSHVGIYIGDNKFIHAPSTGRSVSIDSLMSSFFQNKIVGARRVINDAE